MMNNLGTVLLFDKWIEQIIIHYGEEDVTSKIKFVENFLEKNFHVDDFDNSFIDIKEVHSKNFMWLLLSLIIDYETIKQNPGQ